MDIDLEDALELVNRNHQLCLKKKKGKSRQSRLHHQDFELFRSQSTLSSSSSTYEMNCSSIIHSSIVTGTPDANADADTPHANNADSDFSNAESDIIYYDINEYTQSIDDIDFIAETSLQNSTLHLDETTEKVNSVDFDQLLHPYTDTCTGSFCYHLLRIFRKA